MTAKDITLDLIIRYGFQVLPGEEDRYPFSF
jgi:hypothetical protein